MRRDRQFNVKFSDAEWARLETVATHYGAEKQDVFRMWLKSEADKLARLERPQR